MKRQTATLLFCLFITAVSACEHSSTQKKPEPADSPSENFILNGRIIFQSNQDGDNEIFLLTAKGLNRLTDNEWDDIFPVWSPDGKRIAYAADKEGHYDIFIMKSDGSKTKTVTSGPLEETDPGWYPGGQSIVFTRENKKFMRKEIALYRIQLQTGRIRRIIPGYGKTHAIAHVSPTGTLLAFTGKRSIGWDVAVYNTHSKKVTFLNEGGDSCRPRFSKDGKHIAYVSSAADGKGDIWIMSPDGSNKVRLTERDKTYDYFPSWSPDGLYIVFCSSAQHSHEGDWQLWVVEVSTRKAWFLFDSPGNDVFPDWN
ncbi:MAG: PD40 domain-containing protein [Candidatus Aminicenantes bacterium]|nr:PD40 domain-containing protein [Candidatus Aminicenantes bacterium]